MRFNQIFYYFIIYLISHENLHFDIFIEFHKFLKNWKLPVYLFKQYLNTGGLGTERVILEHKPVRSLESSFENNRIEFICLTVTRGHFSVKQHLTDINLRNVFWNLEFLKSQKFSSTSSGDAIPNQELRLTVASFFRF